MITRVRVSPENGQHSIATPQKTDIHCPLPLARKMHLDTIHATQESGNKGTLRKCCAQTAKGILDNHCES